MSRRAERGTPKSEPAPGGGAGHGAPGGGSGHAAPVRAEGRKPPRRAEVRAVLGFLARFAGGWISVLLLLAFVPAIEHWAVRHTISSLLLVTRPFPLGSTFSGTSFSIGGITIQIVPDCTPLMPTAALWIAIAAFPAPWRWRLAGLAAGALVLWLYNLARILALVPILAYRPALFDFIHVYLWQTVTLLVVFALFLLWLRLQPPRAARA